MKQHPGPQRDIRDRNVKQLRRNLRAMIREKRSEELARAGMANNAARRRRTMAVLKSALAKQ